MLYLVTERSGRRNRGSGSGDLPSVFYKPKKALWKCPPEHSGGGVQARNNRHSLRRFCSIFPQTSHGCFHACDSRGKSITRSALGDPGHGAVLRGRTSFLPETFATSEGWDSFCWTAMASKRRRLQSRAFDPKADLRLPPTGRRTCNKIVVQAAGRPGHRAGDRARTNPATTGWCWQSGTVCYLDSYPLERNSHEMVRWPLREISTKVAGAPRRRASEIRWRHVAC